MNTALLVLRLVPGLLLIGHGLQKLVPAKYSPPLLHAIGPRATAGFFEQLGLRPALLSVIVASLGEIGGGFLIASGLVTPLGTALAAAVMTTAIPTVHIRKGIWNAEGGIEFPLSLSAGVVALAGTGPGSASLDGALGLSYSAEVRALVIVVAVLGALVALAISRIRPHDNAAGAS